MRLNPVVLQAAICKIAVDKCRRTTTWS